MSDKKVKRERPNKKWTKEEINKLLDFLEEADEIEAPTAQFFYKKCIQVKGIEATWDLLRWKVRHLKSTFNKANDYRTSTGAGIDEMDVGVGSFEDKIEKMCPHYNRLNKIFGAKSHAQNNFCAVDTLIVQSTISAYQFAIQSCLSTAIYRLASPSTSNITTNNLSTSNITANSLAASSSTANSFAATTPTWG
ncbi:uncharacterized protein LOC126766411 [Bactrocera neohumeralis]|uniref:uncharacterized protein LOC126766411 n=1 Tax=Bactrocera neohumeralis TaxID=98809 RepID=UPI0021658467|nr:uncharacterized protein LOC126766411 [Bactrocera neohumeralis]